MSKRTQENIVAIIFLVFFIGIIVLSFGYGERARLVPVPIAVASTIFTLIQLILINLNKNIDLSVDASSLFKSTKSGKSVQEDRAKVKAGEVRIKKIEGGKEWVGLALVGLLLVMVLLLGLLPAVFIFVIGYFLIVAKMKWQRALIYTVLCELGIYLLFFYLLNVQTYDGLLLSLLS